MQNPIHSGLARYSFPARYETAWNPACVRHSVLDASPQSGEPGWSSEGTGRGGRNDQRGVFGNARCDIRSQRTCKLGNLSAWWLLTAEGSSGEWSPGPVFNAASERHTSGSKVVGFL
jgi:hypothetical protein